MGVWGSIISWNFRETLTLTVNYCDIATQQSSYCRVHKHCAFDISPSYFFKNRTKRHPIARPWVRDMGCCSWMQSLVENAKSGRSYIIVSVVLCVISCYRWPWHIDSLEYMEMSYYVLNIIRHMDTCNMTSFVLIFNLEEQTLIEWIRSVNRVSWQNFMSTPYTT